jgi:hypothetical protein
MLYRMAYHEAAENRFERCSTIDLIWGVGNRICKAPLLE